MRLSNAEWIPYKGLDGRIYDRLEPKKLLLHTTQGSNISGAMRAYARYPPHIICSYEERRVVQHVSLDRGSYSLAGSESEDEPVIQVEIVGFAQSSHEWPEAKLKWFCDNVFIPIRELWEYKLQALDFYGEGDGIVLASPSSPVRLTAQEFIDFGGILGHQHAPSPDHHWDPGKINIDWILNYMNQHAGEVPVPVDQRTAEKYVDGMYDAILHRKPDVEGRQFWIDQLTSGAMSRNDFLWEFIMTAGAEVDNLQVRIIELEGKVATLMNRGGAGVSVNQIIREIVKRLSRP